METQNKKMLALELAALDTTQRQRLLDELPVDKRNELLELIDAVTPLLAGYPSEFEQVMAQLAPASAAPEKTEGYDETALHLLLGGESVAVKRQLSDVFAHGRTELVTAHVRGLIDAYLNEQVREQGAGLAAPPRPIAIAKPWWRRLWS